MIKWHRYVTGRLRRKDGVMSGRTFGKGIIASVLIAIVVVGVAGGAAFAYFTAGGTGTGSAVVGSSSTWEVTAAGVTGGPLLPGSGTQTINYTITNTSTGSQQLTSTSAELTADSSGNVFDTETNATAAGCLASWFTVTNNPPPGLSLTVAGSASVTGASVTVTMDESGTNQDACQDTSPQVTISVS
jgi:hypothetical protein